MASPNIVSPTSVTLRHLAAGVGSTFSTLVSCAADKSLKVSTIVASNVTATHTAISLVLYNGTATHAIASNVTVPEKASLVIVSRENPVYLTEGCTLDVAAGIASAIHVTGSYEEVT
jgi:hypothetical protein